MVDKWETLEKRHSDGGWRIYPTVHVKEAEEKLAVAEGVRCKDCNVRTELEEKLAEKDKERAKVEQHWSDYALAEVRSLVEETQKKLAEKDKEIERLKNENTNMKKYINQRSDGSIPYPEVEPSYVPFKPKK